MHYVEKNELYIGPTSTKVATYVGIDSIDCLYMRIYCSVMVTELNITGVAIWLPF